MRERAAAVEATLDGAIAPALAALDAHLATHESVLRDKMATEEASEAALTRALADTEVRGLSAPPPPLPPLSLWIERLGLARLTPELHDQRPLTHPPPRWLLRSRLRKRSVFRSGSPYGPKQTTKRSSGWTTPSTPRCHS